MKTTSFALDSLLRGLRLNFLLHTCLQEDEVAKRIADSVASREKEWAEREANMNALLNERELAAKAAQAEALAAAAEAKERLMEVEKASKQQQAEAVKMAEEARVAARAAALAEAEAAAARRQGTVAMMVLVAVLDSCTSTI